MSYRFDNRSPEQFKKDIKVCTLIERKLMTAYVNWLNTGGGKHPAGSYSFIDNGVDNTGEFIKDHTQVHCGADFILKTNGGRDKKIEIKFCREPNDQLHYKINQLKRYVEDDVCIVTFMGLSTNSKFFILTPKQMREMLETGYKCKFYHGKPCIRLYSNKVKWINATIPN